MILVLVENAKDGQLKQVSQELLTKASLMNCGEVAPVCLDIDSPFEDLIDRIKQLAPDIILVGATNNGRDVAALIASSLNTGLTADCTDLSLDENGSLIAIRPTYGGELMAQIMCKTKPQMATVRQGVFGITSTQEIIIAGGRGMKSQAGFELLQQLAHKIGAQLGASRGAVDMGIAPKSIQIGQTGKTIQPRVYIACGISGAIQHTVGMNKSDKIIVINNDKNAPIFKLADIGIVGDVFEVIQQLIKS